jgi:hypothetical protein
MEQLKPKAANQFVLETIHYMSSKKNHRCKVVALEVI